MPRKIILYGEVDKIPGSCGTFNLFRIGYYKQSYDHNRRTVGNIPNKQYSANVAFVNFIDTPECHTAYKILTEKYKIIFQDVPRMNGNSGERGFITLFDVSNERKTECVV